ncbi:MAG: BREX-1 system adenine-specific DNA-methyltransferase PglX, partial [Pontiellaceae bacterium]|nr:BREX-1 system adenine-specific DNA-methyltransferase PglX [Pontiellaceae bacterium]
MDKTELQRKLTQPFDSGRWKEVVECVFPGSQYWAQERVLPSGEEIVERFAEKGFIQMADGKNLALVELHLKKGAVNLPKNRVKLRSLVAGLIDQERAHGVIAVFEQGGQDYRLSFVAKEAVIEDGEFKTRETPAKRYTYLLGPGETCRTAAERLHALSQKQKLKLDDVTDAFNVEKLNKQFFKDYQAQYEKFCSFLTAPENGYRKTVFGIPAKADGKEEKPIRDFVKRLLGRLVFLQFLQKKGWMGCPADSHHWKNGDKRFLQSFFAGCADQAHFHSAFLTPLFYDALNRENRPNALFDLTGTRIPYLNGGLFEDDLPATKTIDFPSDYFQGLLDCFGAYNFTIDENDPMDAEVGIDPEMLGHIFENLLEDNKDKGAYYTPKAIVHYMCQESLLQYLKTGLDLTTKSFVAAIHDRGPRSESESFVAAIHDRGPRSRPSATDDESDFQCLEDWLRSPDKTVSDDRNNFVRKNARQIEELLDTVKICDPAIGSGAFPMGLLQEIYRCKLNLDFTLDPAEVKRGIIQNSIYGVDIEKGAVDIARLRFWLSLVVDEEAPSPLPNLDYKIMQGNSLLESFEGVDLKFEVKRARLKIIKEVDLFGKVINPQDDFIDFLQSASGGDTWDLEQIERAYFEEHDPKKKAEMRRQVDETEKRFINERLDEKIDEVKEILARQKKVVSELEKLDKGKNQSGSREAKKLQTLE